MTNLEQVLFDLVTPMVEEKDQLEVPEGEDSNEKDVVLVVKATNEDIARLIGRKGSMASALRQVMSVASHRENKKVSIGYKQLQPQPWDLVADKYKEGDVVHGKVVRLVPFGAFVEVENGVDALVHVSQISHEWLENPTSVLSIGEEIDAKILVLDPANKKMNLSIKALLPEPEVTKVRTRRDDDKGERRARKPRQPRENKEEDEFREWTEGGVGGASIAEMLQNKNND